MTEHTRDGKVIVNLTGSWHVPTDPLAEGVLRQGAHAVFPEQMSAVATALSGRLGAEKAGPALGTMRDITAGKVVSEASRREAAKAFEEAGLITRNGEMTSVGLLMLKQEGAEFLAKAGIITARGEKNASLALAVGTGGGLAAGVVSTGTELTAGEKAAAKTAAAARITGEAAEGASLGGRVLGTIMKKVPVVGQVIAAGVAIMSIAGAARAEALPPEAPGAPQNPEEKKAREILQMQAGRTMKVFKEVLKGALSLVPVPGADMAFDKYADNEQERMQARAGAAALPRPLEVGDLVQQPGALDGVAPISAYYNAQAQGVNSRAAPAVVLVADGGVPQEKTARNTDAPR